MNLFIEGLKVTIFSMVIVFLVLVILMCVIKIQNRIFHDFYLAKPEDVKHVDEINSAQLKDKQSNDYTNDELNDKEIVAAISAALTMYMGTDLENVNIKSIKKIKGSSEWRKSAINFRNI
ncbi:OadG family protein [Clostridium rectalis]|uniref:OadG family protein n=1 Tax=Clostridium rectalis TaxID=2040295 RepID=UPI000F642346|nr:OadG family protein [Clostridium rectalis]